MKSNANINKRCSDFKLITLAINIINELRFLDEKFPELMTHKKISKLVELSKKWGDIFAESLSK